jgi:hypothetical protein
VVSFLLAFPPISYTHSSSPHACYMPCPSHLPWLYCSNYTWRRVKLWSSSLCSFLQPSITSSFLRQNILLSTLFSNTLSLYSSLNFRDQVLHPYRPTGKVIVLYILIFALLDSRREETIFWTEWYQALPEFNLLLIASWIKCWFVTVVPKYLKCATLPKNLLAIFMSWFCTVFWRQQHILSFLCVYL